MKRLPAILLIFLLVAAGGAALADPAPDAEARALFGEGNRLMAEGDYLAALELYQKAYGLLPSPRILINIAGAQQMLGRNAEAANTYERYLSDPGAEATRRPDVERAIAEFDRLCGRLVVRVEEAGGEG